MEISTKQLRLQPGRVILQACNGQEITVTYRGKPCAKIVPIRKTGSIEKIDSKKFDGIIKDELFGMWKDRNEMKDVEQYVRNIRKGRNLC